MTNRRTFFSLSLRNPVSIYWHVSFLVWLCGPAEHSFFRPAAWHLLDALIDSRVYAKSIYPRSWSISVNLTNMSNSKGLKFITGWQVKIGENLNKALQPVVSRVPGEDSLIDRPSVPSFFFYSGSFYAIKC